MMYKKDKPLALKGSTSAICNNLSVHVNFDKNVINYAVAHKSVVNLVSAATDGSTANHRQIQCREPSSASYSNTMIIQTRIVTFPLRSILVMTSQKGIQMFEGDGSVMLYWYALGEGSQGEVTQCYGRGICSVGDDTICVGTYEGYILEFHIPSRGTNITLSDTHRAHSAAVCDLEASCSTMVSSDECGNVIIWKTAEDFRLIAKIGGFGYPATSVGIWNDLVVVGYGSGHLRVFSASSGKIHCETTAHGKWITSVDVAQRTGLVLTVGEDAHARVWQLRDSSQPTIEHLHSECVPDLQLQGGKFVSDDGRAFGCTGYDNNEILFFTQA